MLSDWYFDPELDPQLDAAVYHSAPSSLSLASLLPANVRHSVCRVPACARIRQGAVEFWYRHSIPAKIVGGIAIRMKTNAPVYDFSNNFIVRDADDFWYLDWWNGLALVHIDEWAFGLPHYTWAHMRVSWFEQLGTLRFRLETEAGGLWSLCDGDIDSFRNDNWNNPVQAVGLIANVWEPSANKIWFDDVKIFNLVTGI